MAFKHGRKAEVYLDSLDVSTYLMDLGLSVNVAVAPATTFKSAWDSFLSGIASVVVNTQGYYDPTASVGSEAIRATLQQAADSVLTVAPAGMQTIGDLTRLVAVESTTFKTSSKVSGVVGFTWDIKSDGKVGFGYILHPLTTDGPGTTTGVGHDDLAATTTGAIAHLHMTAFVSNASWVVKLQDSADNLAWADIASGAFTASVSVVGAQRLVIPGTIRRYVRYVATATGGTNPTITFALAFART